MKSVRSIVVAIVLLVGSVVGGVSSAYALDSGVTYEPGRAQVVDVGRDFLITRTPNGSVWDVYAQRITSGARVWLGQSAVSEPVSAALCDGVPYLAFARATASGTVIEARNTATGVVTRLGFGSMPSAGHDTIAFASNRDGDWDIWTFDCVTGTLTQAVNAPGVQSMPSVGKDYLVWTDYQADSVFVRLRRMGESADSVIGEGTAEERLAVPAITGNDRWVTWMLPEMVTLASRDDWAVNPRIEGMDRAASAPTTVTVTEGNMPKTSYDRIGSMHANAWYEGVNDTYVGHGSLVQVRQQTSTPSVLGDPYEIGRPVTSGYTNLTGYALSGYAAYWSENWEGHESSVRTTSLTTNLGLTANTTAPLRGTPVVLTAKVTTKSGAPVAGALVAFDVWNGTRWSQLGGGRTYSHGMRQIAFTPTAATRVRARLVSTTAAPTFSWQIGIRPR